MVNIDEVLMPCEQVVKKQGGVSYDSPMGAAGDLFLTNMRLIFLNKKRWGVISPGVISGQDVYIHLQNVQSVGKGSFGSLIVRAEKEHRFMVTIWQSGKWVKIIQQTMTLPLQGRQYRQPQKSGRPIPPPPPQPDAGNFCASCERPLEYVQQYRRWYCRTCQRYA